MPDSSGWNVLPNDADWKVLPPADAGWKVLTAPPAPAPAPARPEPSHELLERTAPPVPGPHAPDVPMLDRMMGTVGGWTPLPPAPAPAPSPAPAPAPEPKHYMIPPTPEPKHYMIPPQVPAPTPPAAPPAPEPKHYMIPPLPLARPQNTPLPVSRGTIAPTVPFVGPPDSAQVHVTVNVATKTVTVQDAAGKTLQTFPAFVGRPGYPTPTGRFKIMEDRKLTPDEWYYGGHFLPFYEVKGDQNPYVSDKVRAEDKGALASYGFHGWQYDKDDDETEKIEPGWKTSTHGCVQLSVKDIAAFSKLVRPGDAVTIIGQK
jgi:lipoprotein-anchoring transpeptidase ErfK/SrfK